MKKNNFLSGIGAKLALAVVALTTTMFTSCSNEDIQIDVKPVNARAEINPVVFANGVDVTKSATISFSDNSNGKYEASSIDAKTVTVTASYEGMTGSVDVNVPAVSAGKFWSQSAVIALNYTSEQFDSQAVEGSQKEQKEVTSEDVIYNNPTDYWFYVPVKYTQTTGVKLVTYNVNVANQELVDFIKAQAQPITKKEATQDFPVYAHSRMIAHILTTTVETTYNVVLKSRAGETVLATYTLKTINSAIDGESDAVIPGHGHAPAGHGHGHNAHGADENAGGGIVIPD